nr:MAG TPA: hypothetical protein [Caudoviricetes sp.]
MYKLIILKNSKSTNCTCLIYCYKLYYCSLPI